MSATAIIAGAGRLPRILVRHLTAEGRPPRVLAMEGQGPEGLEHEAFRVEELGALLARLPAEGVGEVIFAGAVKRPAFDPARIDAATAPLVPRIFAAVGQGDDHLLRMVISLFEEAGMMVRGAAEMMPALTAAPGVLVGTPDEKLLGDTVKARAILDALGPLDIGQAAVVAAGLCLGIETIQGTAALLDFVARTRTGQGGVMVKRPKPGQDLRIDMPVIGPDTVAAAAAAKLSGIAIAAGSVIVLDKGETLAAAGAAGLALWAEP